MQTTDKATPKLRILSHHDTRFRDRKEAGRLLARELLEWRGQNAVALGIPRGGIVVAQEVARALDADIDIVLTRKLRTPGHLELAMGSVAENGRTFLNETVIRELGIGEEIIELEKQAQLAEIARRSRLVREAVPRIPLKDRVVIITDDGVATGATTQAAIWAARQEKPRILIAALPVGPDETIRRLAEDVDEMVCLETPPFFVAVGQFYQRFDPVTDHEVLAILKEERQRRAGK